MKGVWVCGEVRGGLSVEKCASLETCSQETEPNNLQMHRGRKRNATFILAGGPMWFAWELKVCHHLAVAIPATMALLLSH